MKIGFIGVGVMGNGMVKNLLKRGYEVNAYTRTRAKALEALDAGAVWCDTTADCVRDVDAVISMVGFPRTWRRSISAKRASWQTPAPARWSST